MDGNTKLRWEVSIKELISEDKPYWKVTRRIPELYVAETRTFKKKSEAIKQHKEWLS